jgi:hypothetical protein
VSNLECLLCGHTAHLFDVVDFNKSCDRQEGEYQLSGIAIYYAICDHCGFCFAPEIMAWTDAELKEKIYNDEYVLIDPEFVEIRPKKDEARLNELFPQHDHIRHLDYGGGEGKLSQLLKNSGWNTISYDPFFNTDQEIEQLGKFDLITVFEVFEHTKNIHRLMEDLSLLVKPEGVIFFSTAVTDKTIFRNKRLDWWYASPRNGHISLFRLDNLITLGQRYGLNMLSNQVNYHFFYKDAPSWFKEALSI